MDSYLQEDVLALYVAVEPREFQDGKVYKYSNGQWTRGSESQVPKDADVGAGASP